MKGGGKKKEGGRGREGERGREEGQREREEEGEREGERERERWREEEREERGEGGSVMTVTLDMCSSSTFSFSSHPLLFFSYTILSSPLCQLLILNPYLLYSCQLEHFGYLNQHLGRRPQSLGTTISTCTL